MDWCGIRVGGLSKNGMVENSHPRRNKLWSFVAGALLFAAVNLCSAQTFQSLASFNGTNGANPILDHLVQGIDGNLYGTTSAGGANSQGTVFKITTAGTLTTLYNFCQQASCSDGNEPVAGLALGTNGNLFGTTYGGGASNHGTVYQITPAGVLTVLHSFNGTDGNTPTAGLVQSPSGTFFGTTAAGGTGTLFGTIFSFTSAGKFTSLHSFAASDGSDPYGRLVLASNGSLYGATTAGGSSNLGTVFKVTASGTLTSLASFNGTNGMQPLSSPVQASNGNFYGATSGGGANGHGTLFQMTAAGTITTLYNFCPVAGCVDGSTPSGFLIQATDGNLYGTTRSGGKSNAGTIFKITTAGVVTTLYNFCPNSPCPDGSLPMAGLVQATDGNLYGATYYGGTGSGTIYSLSVGMAPFVRLLQNSGKVGAKIAVLGSNLTGASAVSFNGTSATFTVVSAGEVSATVPAGATSGAIKVTAAATILSSSTTFKVLPQIKSFTPASGAVGSTITITGVSLLKTTKVTIGGVAATFTINSDTSITVTVPTGAKTGKIAVTTSGGGASSATTFTVT